MKAVLPNVPEHILEWRARTGAAQWDEMWEGVLHMPPVPNRHHQHLEWSIETWLRTHWCPAGNEVYHEINVASVGGWPDNYRIPDLVLLTPDRFGIDKNAYFEGGPTVVVEIRSPGDESYEKLPFYAEIGVAETWIIDPEADTVEVFAREGTSYQSRTPDAEGWVTSEATGVQLRAGSGGKLLMRMAGELGTQAEMP